MLVRERKKIQALSLPQTSKLNMKRHIIFDFDDTISSAYEHNQQLFVDTFLQYKPDIDQEYVRMVHYKNRGKAMIPQFEEVIGKFGLKVSSEQLEKENEEIHRKHADEVKIFSGFEDILKHLKRLGKIVSICTNRAEGSLRLILTNNNLGQYFDNIVSCRKVNHEKPDPYCLLQLIEKYPDISNEDTIYFGDSETDAHFAQNAGIDYLVIDHYLNKKQFYNLIVDSFVGGDDELLVEVDKNNEDIGSIYRMEAINNPKRFHRSVHVVVFNSKGQLVLEKRSKTKVFEPGKWDVVGGWQSFGIDVKDAARNELSEEFGISQRPKFVKTIFNKDWGAFCNVYYCVSDGPLKIDDHEVEEIREFDCEKLLNHEYDDFEILPHVYKYVSELSDVWKKLIKGG